MYPALPADWWHYFRETVLRETQWEAIRIDGLRGVYYPGHGCCWVDYDEGLIYE